MARRAAIGGARLRAIFFAAALAFGAARTHGGEIGDVCACGDAVAGVSGCAACATGSFCGFNVTASGGCASGDELLWVRSNYFLCSRDGVDAPPLITASPAGTPLANVGVLGLPTTEVLFGGGEIGNDVWSGFGIEGGVWLNPHTGWALAADYFNHGRNSYGLTVGPNDGRFLARPFLDTQPNPPAGNSILVEGPAQFSGRIQAAGFDDFQGAGGWMEKCVWAAGNACTDQGSARLSVLGGYRFYHQDSLLFVRARSTALAGNSFGQVAGEINDSVDQFIARNEFHGAELGVQGRVQRCAWWLDGLAGVAFGGTRRVVFVNGATLVAAPNGGSGVVRGGLLATDSNIGRYVDDIGQAIPRFRLGVGWQASERLSLHFGYNVVIWEVVQAASHLPPNLEVDARNLPDAAGSGAEPIFPGFRDTTMAAHGLDFGLELWF